jgi:HK97 family phage portal protein
MRKYNLFNFLESKVNDAEISTITAKMLEQAAFKELALHIAISYIANTLSKCKVKVYKDGVEDDKSLFYYLLNVSPNQNQNASQFMNKLVEKYFYDGEALVVMQNDMLYCADSFDVDETNPLKEYIYNNVSFNCQQIKKKLKASEVFHFKLDNKDVKKLIDLLYSQYGEIIALALQTFKATNGRKYKLILDNYKAGDPQFAQQFESVIKKQLQTFIQNDNAVYPQFKGTSLEEFQTSGRADTADIITMRKEIFETTAQAFKIPLSMMYGNITNMNEIVKVYLSVCIEPIADMISEELTRKRFTYDEWKNGNYIEVDTTCINYVDILEVADKADKAIASGVASIDDIRPRVRLKPLDTEFSTAHFITKNYELAENMLKNLDGEGGER